MKEIESLIKRAKKYLESAEILLNVKDYECKSYSGVHTSHNLVTSLDVLRASSPYTPSNPGG